MSFLEYWFLFPITLAIATVGMAAGVEALGCIAPLLLSGLQLSPEVAIGAGLITSGCACVSALFAYLPTQLIDYKIGLKFLMAFVPAAVLGVSLGVFSSELVQEIILSVSLLAVAISFLRSPQKLDIVLMNQTIEQVYGGNRAETRLTTDEGEQISYTATNLTDGLGIAAISGLFLGLTSNGLGELNSYYWVQRCRVPSQVAIATTIFVLTITIAIAASGYTAILFFHKSFWFTTLLKVTLFTVPGALIGGQLGSIVADRMPLPILERVLAGGFTVLGIWTLRHAIV